jgi:hypothetical protein
MTFTLAEQRKEAGRGARDFLPVERIAWNWEKPCQQAGSGNAGVTPEQLGWLLTRWRVDPVMFAVEALRVTLAPYQAEILLDLADAPAPLYAFYGSDPSRPKRQVLVPSGHGLGKTRALAVAIWWHLLTHRFSMTLCTAPSSDQLTGRLWGELRKLYRRLKARWPVLADEWDILGTSVSHKNPDFGDWSVVARTARPEKPEALQGAHALDVDDEFGVMAALFGEQAKRAASGGIMVVIEEASGVDDTIRQTLEGALSEEGARLIAPGNPTRPDGWFANDCERKDRYAVHPLDCRISNRNEVAYLPYRDFGGNVHQLPIRGFVRPAYWEEILRECDGDEDADLFRVRVRGLRPRSGFTKCIKTHWIDSAMSRQPDPDSKAEPAIIALDFGLTSDKHAMAVRRGYSILDGDEWLPKDAPDQITLDAADRAIEAVKLYRAKYIIGDSNGIGRGAMEYLSRYYQQADQKARNVTVIHFNSGAGAVDGTRYHTRRDEMWMSKGRAFFANQRCYLPDLPGLRTQLKTPGYHEDTRRKIRVESKGDILKRTGEPSGNLADAILMSLMVVTYQAPEAKPNTDPVIPELFKRAFARFQSRQGAGGTIR